jgi:hypothetical protein
MIPSELRRGILVGVWLGCVGLSACTPTLNWRDVQLGRLSALLPCKPDRASRPVQLAEMTLQIEMAGCEAADAMVAISHLRLDADQNVEAALNSWRANALRNMRARIPAELPLRPGVSVFLRSEGTNAEGKSIHAHLAWLVDHQDIFHVAVYAKHANPELIETLFTQVKLQ